MGSRFVSGQPVCTSPSSSVNDLGQPGARTQLCGCVWAMDMALFGLTSGRQAGHVHLGAQDGLCALEMELGGAHWGRVQLLLCGVQFMGLGENAGGLGLGEGL